MAEKEERIVCCIIKKGYDCDYCFSRFGHQYYQCSISNNDCTYDKCKQCSLGMTRQEAIEKMENGWKKKAEEKLPIPLTAKEVLEAALNALLEGK